MNALSFLGVAAVFVVVVIICFIFVAALAVALGFIFRDQSKGNVKITDKMLAEVKPSDDERYDLVSRAKMAAISYNNNLPFWKKITGKESFCAMDILQNTANHEFRSQLDCLFDGVMSITSWKRITKIEFDALVEKTVTEFKREDKTVSTEQVFEHYRGKALRFAQWLDDTKYRPFFMGSENEIIHAINHIRSIAS